MIREEAYRVDLGAFAYTMAMAISDDDTYVLIGTESTGNVILKEISSDTVVCTRNLYNSDVGAVAFGPQGDYVASGGSKYSNYNVYLLDITDGSTVWGYTGHGDNVNSLAFSPNGDYLCSVSSDGTLKFLNIADGSVDRSFNVSTRSTVEYTLDGKFLVNGGGGVRLIRPSDNSEVWVNNDVSGARLSVSRDSKYIATGSGSTLSVLNVDDGSLVWSDTGNFNALSAVAISKDGNYVASAGGYRDQHLRLYEITDGSLIWNDNSYEETTDITFDSVGNLVVGTRYLDVVAFNLYEEVVYLKGTRILNESPGKLYSGISLDNLRYAQNSNIYTFGFANFTTVPIENVQISASAEPAGVDLTMSKTKEPFSAAQSLTFTGPYDANTGEDTFYIRVESTTAATEGPVSVNLNISADNYVG